MVLQIVHGGTKPDPTICSKSIFLTIYNSKLELQWINSLTFVKLEQNTIFWSLILEIIFIDLITCIQYFLHLATKSWLLFVAHVWYCFLSMPDSELVLTKLYVYNHVDSKTFLLHKSTSQASQVENLQNCTKKRSKL